jgi:hypothetical protein
LGVGSLLVAAENKVIFVVFFLPSKIILFLAAYVDAAENYYGCRKKNTFL